MIFLLFYHLITKLFFNEYPWEAKQSAIFFLAKVIARRRKAWFLLPKSRILFCSQTQLDDIAPEQNITQCICRQLFPGHVVGSQPMKWKKNLLWIIRGVLLIASNQGSLQSKSPCCHFAQAAQKSLALVWTSTKNGVHRSTKSVVMAAFPWISTKNRVCSSPEYP